MEHGSIILNKPQLMNSALRGHIKKQHIALNMMAKVQHFQVVKHPTSNQIFSKASPSRLMKINLQTNPMRISLVGQQSQEAFILNIQRVVNSFLIMQRMFQHLTTQSRFMLFGSKTSRY